MFFLHIGKRVLEYTVIVADQSILNQNDLSSRNMAFEARVELSLTIGHSLKYIVVHIHDASPLPSIWDFHAVLDESSMLLCLSHQFCSLFLSVHGQDPLCSSTFNDNFLLVLSPFVVSLHWGMSREMAVLQSVIIWNVFNSLTLN